jgi:hypothetical protein
MAAGTTTTKRRRGRPPAAGKVARTAGGGFGGYYQAIPANISTEWEQLRAHLLTLTPWQRMQFQHAVNCDLMSLGILNPVVSVGGVRTAIAQTEIPAHLAGAALDSNVRATA